jgi:CheY-like chemotaxis protein
MSNFVTLLVEDDAFQREVLADVLKDEGFEVIECTTAEAAELIIASTGTELQALITDQNLAGKMSGAELAHYARCRPAYEHCHHVRHHREPYAGRYGVLAKAFLSRAATRHGSGVTKSVGASLRRSRVYPTPSVHRQFLADSGG